MLNTFERRLKYESEAETEIDIEIEAENDEEAAGARAVPSDEMGNVLYAELSHAIVAAAIEVHRHIGPGQLESVYQHALGYELGARGIPHRAHVPIAMLYKGHSVGEFFADVIVDDRVIVELKAVATILPVHVAQTLGYLNAAKLRLGLLINFNVPVLWRGVRRLIH